MKAAPLGRLARSPSPSANSASVPGQSGLAGWHLLSHLDLFVVVILGAVARFCGFSILKLIRYLKAELLLVLGTSSSESALPSLMQKMEKPAAASRWSVWWCPPAIPSTWMARTSI
jgi:aerobic C4-dicarboxylate transport protein